ncbi:MAG: hypothetical protein GY811_11940 [Myxococcales bacterium]|nr:hypothetical protein [Myxococcales bacterium]
MKRTSLQILAFASLIAISACSKEKEVASAGSESGAEAPLKPIAGNAADKATAPDPACPSATLVTSMKFKAPGAEPLAIAPEKFIFAKARLAEPGKLQVNIATQEWPIAQLGLPKSPIESAEDAYLGLTIRSEDFPAGMEYTETGDLESKISTTLFTKGLASGVHTAPPSMIKILAYSAGSVYGEFALQGIFDGDSTKLVGTFVAPIASR